MMGRILVYPDKLFDLSSKIMQVSNQIQDMDRRLQRSFQSVTLESKQRADIEYRIRRASSLARSIANDQMQMAKKLKTKTERIVQVDQQYNKIKVGTGLGAGAAAVTAFIAANPGKILSGDKTPISSPFSIGSIIAGGAPLVKGIHQIYKTGWEFHDKFLVQGIASAKNGFRIGVNGNYAHVYGKRFLTDGDSYFTKKYLEWRKDLDLRGTRYGLNNPSVGKILNAKDYILDGIKSDFSLKGKDLIKGGGILGLGMDTLANVAEYGWGAKKDKGIASTDFAASLTVDVATGVAVTAISSGASWLAAAGTAAAVGSVVPGVGTAVGFVVGAGSALFLMSDTGKALTDGTKAFVKNGMDYAGEKLEQAGKAIKDVGKQAGEAIKDAGNAIKDAGKEIGNTIKDVGKSAKNLFGNMKKSLSFGW
jgi:gas vesicle protein